MLLAPPDYCGMKMDNQIPLIAEGSLKKSHIADYHRTPKFSSGDQGIEVKNIAEMNAVQKSGP